MILIFHCRPPFFSCVYVCIYNMSNMMLCQKISNSIGLCVLAVTQTGHEASCFRCGKLSLDIFFGDGARFFFGFLWWGFLCFGVVRGEKCTPSMLPIKLCRPGFQMPYRMNIYELIFPWGSSYFPSICHIIQYR